MIAIYSGTSPARVYEPEPPREQTRQFPSPVFVAAKVELTARVFLMSRYVNKSPIARARLRVIGAYFHDGDERKMLDAFDLQAREALGVPL